MGPDWDSLRLRFPASAVDILRKLYEKPGSLSVTAENVAADARCAPAEAERFLESLAAEHWLERRESIRCSACGSEVDETHDDGNCPVLQQPFVPRPTVRYELRRGAPRDVPWVLVLHGMNTRGTWQEELSWLISRSYRTATPVAIYKYGIVRPGVLFRRRQRQLAANLAEKIVTLAHEASGDGYGGTPDVIAHSFGTWLIAHALAADARLRIGRLILLGCIVRPDFDWQRLVRKGRIERILNHGASRDIWARVSDLAIPDSGPGGVRGFPPPVVNVTSSGLRHSDYFLPTTRMTELFTNIWQPFLKWEDVPPLPGQHDPAQWKPKPAALRALTRTIVIALFALLTGAAGGVWLWGLWSLIAPLL